jgi:hypothetical protein
MTRKHDDETEVAAAIAAKSKSTRVKKFQYLIKQGVYLHNVEVLREENGELIVCRAPCSGKVRDSKDFLPCPYCYEFFMKRVLSVHCKKCKFRSSDEDDDSKKQYVSCARAMLSGSVVEDTGHIDESLLKDVILRMRIDDITRVVKADQLILKFGMVLLKTLGSRRSLDISVRMRELARVLLKARSIEPVQSLDKLISPGNFDTVIAAIEAEGKPENDAKGRRMFLNPSFVIKVGGSLLKCAELK